MRPEESARTARRIARVVTVNPSLEDTRANLADLMSAVNGDKDAAQRLAARLPSKTPEMAELNRAFTAGSIEPPEMRYVGRGRWVGAASGVSFHLHTSPDGAIQKVLVAGKPVSSWKEAVEAVRYHAAMADNGTPEDAEDISKAQEAIGDNAIHCLDCDGPVDLDADMACKKCGKEYVTCPGCEKPYPMHDNEDDHCPLCGYSSWGELPEEVSAAWIAALKKAAAAAAKTRKPQKVDFQGFDATVQIIDRDGVKMISVEGGDDADEDSLEDWMAEPSALISGGLDTYLWQKNHTPMKPPRPYHSGGDEGQQQQQE